MNRIGKSLSTLLIILLCFMIGLASADSKNSDFQYKVLDDGTVEITKYIGNSTYVDFPKQIDGHTVSSIGSSAFEGCSRLTNIYYFSSCSVVRIGDRAFKGCTSLEYIDIPKGLTTIGDSAFEGCTRMQNAYYMSGSSVTSFGERAFMGCTSLEYIDIPKGLTSIPDSAFEGCTKLEKAYYMSGSAVTKIGKNAFKNCSNLEDIDASKGLTEIGESAFEGCTKLERIYYLKENNVTIGVNAFARCPNLSNVPRSATIDESRLSASNETPSPAPTVSITEAPTAAKPSDPNGWICPNCGYDAIGNFCNNCGSPRPEETVAPESTASDEWDCPNCGYHASGNFCNNCGSPRGAEASATVTTPSPEPTNTPKPTAKPAPAAKWTGDVKKFSSGTYYVGTDLPADTYLFRQIEGDDYVPIIYVYNADQTKADSGNADKNGCVLNVKDGQILKISWTEAYVSKFDTTWAENETKTLPSGTYYVGSDIPVGSYQFKQIEGDDYTPVLYVYNADNLKEKIDSANASNTGCMLNLREGQVLKITWTATITSKFDTAFANGETKFLPSGTYYIGTDLPAGTYDFKPIQGDDYTPVLYVYNADNLKKKIDSASVYDRGCSLTLKDGQVLKITWTGTYATLSNSEGMISNTTKATSATTATDNPKPEPTPTEKVTTAPVTEKPKQTRNYDDSLESVVAYMLSPNDSSLKVNVVELGEGSFTASAAGKSYYGYYFTEDDSYMIEMALTSSGSYDSVDSPFDYTSDGFKQVLNFLLKKNGRSVTSVYPILGDIYGVKDSKGTTYMIQVAYSESMIVVSLITWD